MQMVSRVGMAAAALGLLSGLTPASAGMVSYTNYAVENNVNVHISCGSVPDCQNGYFGSGRIDFYNSGPLVAQTYCIDVSHDLLGSGTFEVTLPVNNGGISNIRNDGGSGHGNFLSWTLLGEIGGLMKYGASNFADPNVSSAVQLAIWELEYAGTGLTTNSDSSVVNMWVTKLLNELQLGQIDSYWGVAWLHYCDQSGRNCNQGKLTLVPEPSSLAVAGSGLLLLLGFFVLRRRNDFAARGARRILPERISSNSLIRLLL